MFGRTHKPSRVDTLEQRVADLEAQGVQHARAADDAYQMALDAVDELQYAQMQRAEIEQLIRFMRKFAAARGFAFDASATPNPMMERAAAHTLSATRGAQQ